MSPSQETFAFIFLFAFSVTQAKPPDGREVVRGQEELLTTRNSSCVGGSRLCSFCP